MAFVKDTKRNRNYQTKRITIDLPKDIYEKLVLRMTTEKKTVNELLRDILTNEATLDDLQYLQAKYLVLYANERDIYRRIENMIDEFQMLTHELYRLKKDKEMMIENELEIAKISVVSVLYRKLNEKIILCNYNIDDIEKMAHKEIKELKMLLGDEFDLRSHIEKIKNLIGE